MSNPTRQVRQPGRTAQHINWGPGCGLCSNGMPGPLGLVVHGLNSTGSCCIEPFDNGGTAMPLTADPGNCGRTDPAFCSYTYDQTFIGTPFVWTVDISCVPDGAGGYQAHVHVSLDEILSGGALHNIAYGDWYSSSFASCGNFDCTFLGNSVGGTLTVTDVGGSWCRPANCGSPTWGLNTGNVESCAQPAAKNCCCGGQVANCLCLHIEDAGQFVTLDPNHPPVGLCQSLVKVCYDKTQGAWVGDNEAVTASIVYSTTPLPHFTITFDCSYGTRTVEIDAGSAGWSRQNGLMYLSAYELSSGFLVETVTLAQCTCCGGACTTCPTGDMIVEYHTGDPSIDGAYLLHKSTESGYSCVWTNGNGITLTITGGISGNSYAVGDYNNDLYGPTGPITCATLSSSNPLILRGPVGYVAVYAA